MAKKLKKEQKLQRALVNLNKKIHSNSNYWSVKKSEILQLSEDLDFNIFKILPDNILKNLVTHGGYQPPTIGFKHEGVQ
jgi:hypothetical protein